MAALLIAGLPLLAFVGGASFSSRVALAPTATAALQLETLPSISVRPRPHPFAPPPPFTFQQQSKRPTLAETRTPPRALAVQATFPSLLLHETSRRLKSSAVALRLKHSMLQLQNIPADDIMLALVSPEAYWLLREWRMQAFGAQEAMKACLESTKQQIRAMGNEHPVLRHAAVAVRSKGLWSTFHKATVRQKTVHDVLAVRVVVRGEDAADVYEALAAIRHLYPSVGEGRFKDYVRRPKPNGYQGLHDTLRLPNGQLFEIQVRTERMHEHAMWGGAAHRKYKSGPMWLSQRMLSGVASGVAAAVPGARGQVTQLRWPLHGQTALTLASRVAGS